MAKKATKRPETKTATLSSGAKITGSAELVDRLVARDGGGKRKSKAAKPAPAPAPEPRDGVITTDAVADSGQVSSAEPPERPNRGASLAAWASFADAVGYQYPAGASRDEIRDGYEAEHPAE